MSLMRVASVIRRTGLRTNQFRPFAKLSQRSIIQRSSNQTIHQSFSLSQSRWFNTTTSQHRFQQSNDHSNQSTNVSDSPFVHIAIVGCGPAGFYTAKYLLKANPSIRIDLIDRLPVPFGLARFGVAPDHPEVKAVTHDFQSVMDDPRARFIGNLEINDQSPSSNQSDQLTPIVSLSELRSMYHGVVLSYGAQSERTLSLPNAHLSNILPARSFVNWYNGHPDHQSEAIDLTAGSSALIIGQGNVAIDCARVLLGPLEHFAPTDITTQSYQSMKQSTINEVHLVGRRGPLQSAFTTAEFREICHLQGIQPVLDPTVVAEAETGKGALELKANRPKKRKMALIKDVANKSIDQSINQSTSKKLYFDFFLNPVEFVENPSKPGSVGAVRCEKMRLEWTDDAEDCFDCRSVGTGELIEVPANLVLESIGYRSLPIDKSLPFDRSTHTISSSSGRVESMSDVYVAGWLKRGPTGIIGSNIADARETVAAVVEDLPTLETKRIEPDMDLLKHLHHNGARVVDKAGWKLIDQYETKHGEAMQKNRLKLTDVRVMLEVAEGKRQ